MESLAYVVTSGWASGISVYAMVLVTGLAGRFGDLETVPHAFERTDVLIVAAVLTALEFVADKIPFLDSAWDAVHTVIRPVVAAVTGAAIAGQADDFSGLVGALLGGTTALGSHSTKASLRLAVNSSPEPLSNIALSLTEDTAVVGVLLLAVHHPWAAFAIALTLLLAGVALVTFAIRRIRRGARRVQARFERRQR